MRGEGTACDVTRSWRESQPQCEGVSAGAAWREPCARAPVLSTDACLDGGIRRVEKNSEVPDPGGWEKLKKKLRAAERAGAGA